MTENENEPGEHTAKVMLLAKSAMHSEIRTVKRIQFWASLGIALIGLGFSAALFFNRYATATDLEKLSTKHDAVQETLQQHVVNETAQISELKTITKRSHEDYHYMREQMREVAKATHGAKLVPLPAHEKPEGE